MITYIAEHGSCQLVVSGDNIEADINIQDNGSNSYQVVQVGTGETN